MGLHESRYRVDIAQTAQDLAAAHELRALAFRGHAQADDRDDLDPITTHVLLRDRLTGQAAATFRVLMLNSGADLGKSYAARHYDLAGLAGFDAPMMELGRVCLAQGIDDPDILRTGWGAITRMVDARAVQLLFGCSSFAGTAVPPHAATFALLRDRHGAPAAFCPGVKSPEVVRFCDLPPGPTDRRTALKGVPQLLKSYLKMGAWVSNHAVVDRDLNTLHVFTGLQVSRIPQSRQRVLRAVAG